MTGKGLLVEYANKIIALGYMKQINGFSILPAPFFESPSNYFMELKSR